MVRQYRHATGEILLELPAGKGMGLGTAGMCPAEWRRKQVIQLNNGR